MAQLIAQLKYLESKCNQVFLFSTDRTIDIHKSLVIVKQRNLECKVKKGLYKPYAEIDLNEIPSCVSSMDRTKPHIVSLQFNQNPKYT